MVQFRIAGIRIAGPLPRNLLLACFAMVVVGLFAEASRAEVNAITGKKDDVIYVANPDQDGVFVRRTGKITRLECGELILDTESGESLYLRNAVHRVILSDGSADPHGLVEKCWNRKSQVLNVTLKLPFVETKNPWEINIPFGAQIFIAILILSGICVFVAYRVYETLVVASNFRKLNTTKLTMEIRKLGHELEELGVKLTDSTPESITDQLDKEIFPIQFNSVRANFLDFLKYSVLRMLTADQIQQREEHWRKRWQNFKKNNSWMMPVVYYFRMFVNIVGTAFVFLFGLGSLTNVFLFPTDPEFGGPAFGIVYFVFFFASAVLLLRLNAKRRILRNTYADERSA